MRKGTVKLFLTRKIKEWLTTIVDEGVRNLARDNVLVCGGAIASMLKGEKVNDYDLYFRNRETVLALAQYYVNTFNDSGKKTPTTNAARLARPEVRTKIATNILGYEEDRVFIYTKSAGIAGDNQENYRYFEMQPDVQAGLFLDDIVSTEASQLTKAIDEVVEAAKDKSVKFTPAFFSENAITLKNKIQLVLRFYGGPEEIFKNYDFAHAMCCYDFKNNNLILHPEALESLLNKRLLYRGGLYPIATLFRIRKFLYRGWRISAGQLIKLAYQLSSIDFTDIELLKDQLTGVDVAYMSQLLHELESNGQRLDDQYIAELCERIFE